jgi:Helix-turn-helix domain
MTNTGYGLGGVCSGAPASSRVQGVSKTGGDHDQRADGDDEDLLTEEEAAALVRVSLSAVRQLRLAGSGPPHVGIGRQTRYRQAVVQGRRAGEGQRSPADNR